MCIRDRDYTEVFAQVTKCDGSFLVGREKDASFTWDKLAGKHILPGLSLIHI